MSDSNNGFPADFDRSAYPNINWDELSARPGVTGLRYVPNGSGGVGDTNTGLGVPRMSGPTAPVQRFDTPVTARGLVPSMQHEDA